MAIFDKINANGDVRDFRDAAAVRFNESQSLTDAQKAQGRRNIGAAGSGDLQNAIDNSVHVNDAQTLTDVQKAQARENMSAASVADVNGKVAISQGIAQAGKAMIVGSDGNVTTGDAVKIDDTLTKSGEAADAAAVGTALGGKLDKVQDPALHGKLLYIKPRTGEIGFQDDLYVTYSEYWSPSDEIKAQARENIDAASVGEVNDLKSALDQKKWNINNSENWEVGYYGRSTGEYQYYPSNLASCCMINKIPDDVFLVTCSNTFKMRLHGWNAQNEYVGIWNGSVFNVPSASNIQYFTSLDIKSILTAYPNYALKIVLASATSDTTPVPLSDVTDVEMYTYSVKYEEDQINSLKEYVPVIDRLNTEVYGETDDAPVVLVMDLKYDSSLKYVTAANNKTLYFKVNKNYRYSVTCTKLSSMSTTKTVNLVFSTSVPDNNVSCVLVGTLAISDSTATYNFEADEDGYFSVSFAYSQSSDVDNVSVLCDYLGLQNEIFGQINAISLWEEGYYGATGGAYTPKNESNPMCCMKYNLPDEVKAVTCPNTLKMRLHGWDSEGVYKGTWTGSIFSKVASSNITYFTKFDIVKIRASYPSYALKIVLANDTTTVDVPLSDTILVYMSANRIDYLVNEVAEQRIGNEPPIDFAIDSNMLKRAVSVNEIGTISLYQSFCEYGGKYYSTAGSSITVQNADFSKDTSVGMSLGHGNAFMRGSSNLAYVSGWDDNNVYVVDLDTLTLSDTIALPEAVHGYTTVAVDDVNKIMYIFHRTTSTGTVENYHFTAWDYDNDQILYTKLITNGFAAMQSCDFYNGKILVLWGKGTVSAPSGFAVYDTNGNMLVEYNIAIINASEPEGVCYDRTKNRLLFSMLSQKVYEITPSKY